MAHGKTGLIQVRKRVHKRLFIYSTYNTVNIGRKLGLEEDEHRFKTGGEKTNNLHLADDTTLGAENSNDLEAHII